MSGRERRLFADAFKREAVRLTETSGRTVAQVADDLGVGRSTLTRWKRHRVSGCRGSRGGTVVRPA